MYHPPEGLPERLSRSLSSRLQRALEQGAAAKDAAAQVSRQMTLSELRELSCRYLEPFAREMEPVTKMFGAKRPKGDKNKDEKSQQSPPGWEDSPPF